MQGNARRCRRKGDWSAVAMRELRQRGVRAIRFRPDRAATVPLGSPLMGASDAKQVSEESMPLA
jgi:hypothetical protein